MEPEIVRNVGDLRARLATWRVGGETIGFVPTMGALHEGHLSLARAAAEKTDHVVASVFVNPTQFGPNEDLHRYPRDEAGDRKKLGDAGVSIMYVPQMQEVYPMGEQTRVILPELGDILEGAYRPGFFTGVATVVAKLLIQVLPTLALFGEKDYQQLLVVQRMATDLSMPTRIEGLPTIRESDGLAMSSRNVYLGEEERVQAKALYEVIKDMARRFRSGESPEALSQWATGCLVDAGFRSVDYVTVRDAGNLSEVEAFDEKRKFRILAAAHMGGARLIDNIAV
ncbi:pantoate--beta-alanine ligase [Magnetospira sp. QH-2]|uniref:pantoate--beta-alanine ligase n=1 Tax=Magnetospira sp. (strain QH-2) TaxID=1288970 RepID=UPI0003E81434|nr:pantoate--beta-alanine ligase [Magnetospira sp. QH-2]CCQ72129.1 Pantothenate synthetase [Magnetospira sp. QH-2]